MKASLRVKAFVVLTVATLAVGAGIIGIYAYNKKDAENKPEEVPKEVEVAPGGQAGPIRSSGPLSYTSSATRNTPLKPERSEDSFEIVQRGHSSTDSASNSEDEMLEITQTRSNPNDAKQIFNGMLDTVNTLISMPKRYAGLSKSMKMNDHTWIVIIKTMRKIIEMNEMTAEIKDSLNKALELLGEWISENAALMIKHAEDALENALLKHAET